MSEATELFSKFQHIWQAGTDARLSLECHAGQVRLNLQVHLLHPPQQHHPPRQGPSPSRLRRHAKRAEARAAEKATVNTNTNSKIATANACVQTDYEPFTQTSDDLDATTMDEKEKPPEINAEGDSGIDANSQGSVASNDKEEKYGKKIKNKKKNKEKNDKNNSADNCSEEKENDHLVAIRGDLKEKYPDDEDNPDPRSDHNSKPRVPRTLFQKWTK